MKHCMSIILLAACLLSCSTRSEHWGTLLQAESYIEEKPDSALAVLERIALSSLSGKKEKAKHALLHSMALDKNYIDKTDFEILQPAIDYYRDKGSATDKLRTCYYQGRIYQNQGNDALAMECFVNAISAGNGSDDILTIARTYFAQGRIYYMCRFKVNEIQDMKFQNVDYSIKAYYCQFLDKIFESVIRGYENSCSQ